MANDASANGLPQLAFEPLPSKEASTAKEIINLVFDRPGSLGIEFERLAAPYVVEVIHDGGLAFGRGLVKGDRVHDIEGEGVDSLLWDDFVQRVQRRPVSVNFVRVSAGRQSGGTAGLLSGFGFGSLRGIGGKVASSAQQGLDGLGGIGGSLGGLSSKVTSSAQEGFGGLGGFGGKVGDLGGKMTSSLVSGLQWSMQDALAGVVDQDIAEPVEMPNDPQSEKSRVEDDVFFDLSKDASRNGSIESYSHPVVEACESMPHLVVDHDEHHREVHTPYSAAWQGKGGSDIEAELVSEPIKPLLEAFENIVVEPRENAVESARDAADFFAQDGVRLTDNEHMTSCVATDNVARIAVAEKEVEVKDLLRQLANAGPPDLQTSQAEAEALGQPKFEALSSFEVMFALPGSLGLEFLRLEPPYVVKMVHGKGVASGLGISPGDELVGVADSDVSGAPWDDLVSKLSVRPVVAKFRRQATGSGSAEKPDGFMSSVSSVGSSLLTVARSAVSLKTPSNDACVEAAPHARLQAEVERLRTLLKARDAEVTELTDRIAQRDAALSALQGADVGAADTAQLVQDRVALTQLVEQLRAVASDAMRQVEQLQAERDGLSARCHQEALQSEEYRRESVALAERCNSLLTQFESLRATCENLHLDVQQKAVCEQQVEDLTRINAQWQHAHQSLHEESEILREQAMELQRLRAEVGQLRRFEVSVGDLEQRLREADQQLDAQQERIALLQRERACAEETIRRLQALLESLEDSGETQTSALETELLERSREITALRQELGEQRRQAEELSVRQRELIDQAEQGRTSMTEITGLRQHIESLEQEKRTLSSVVDRCVERLEKDSRERPHLVDKRMVTQMLAAFLEQREHPRHAQEIMAKMADVLGFTAAERTQVGLSQPRRSLVPHEEEPASLSELSDRFMDFLLEESEA